LKTLLVLINLTIFAFLSCALVQHTTNEPVSPSEKAAFETYIGIQDVLENSGDTIDYDTLMLVYTSIAQSKYPIPHIDHLLRTLMNKRNNNPRIDQMILIFSGLAIGDSKFPIPNVYELFESILEKNSRLNEWVISFVAASIGKYPFDIPNGDSLVDLLEERLAQVTAMNTSISKESFGFHFIPPPQSDYIISYIRGIQEQHSREIERASYYFLIQSGFSETEIENALKRIQKQGISGTGEKCPLPMKYIRFNLNSVF
jgi:hypothetical protein